MELVIIFLIWFAVICWYLIGIIGFIFWWTREFDFETTDIPIAVFSGFIGPISWVFGWSIHGKSLGKSKILVRSKK